MGEALKNNKVEVKFHIRGELTFFDLAINTVRNGVGFGETPEQIKIRLAKDKIKVTNEELYLLIAAAKVLR
jgi:hypothetical protein